MPGDHYPETLRPEIDALNERIYHTVNNGVYKAGFATTQAAYEEAVVPLFETLDWLDDLLATRRYLTGAQVTEADWRLFTTLVRFDPVYVGHFKCNLRRIEDYRHLSGYLRDLYQLPGVAETVNMRHIKGHYHESHTAAPLSRAPKTCGRSCPHRANLRMIAPAKAESVEPVKTPIFTVSCNSGELGNASSPINRLIVKPIPQSSDTP